MTIANEDQRQLDEEEQRELEEEQRFARWEEEQWDFHFDDWAEEQWVIHEEDIKEQWIQARRYELEGGELNVRWEKLGEPDAGQGVYFDQVDSSRWIKFYI